MNERRRDRLLDKRICIERELSHVKQEIAVNEHNLTAFDGTLERYRRGDELNEARQAHLPPTYETLINREECAKQKDSFDELPKLPKTMKV